MKKLSELMMSNKYFLVVFVIVVFGLKFLFSDFDIPGKYLPILSILKTVFLIVLIICFLYAVSLFVFAFISKDKPEHWWENEDHKPNRAGKDKLLNAYMKGWIIAVPLAFYGALVYLAIFHPWRNIIGVIVAVVIIRIINYFRNNRQRQLHSEL